MVVGWLEIHWDMGNVQELVEGWKCSCGGETSMALELLS
jgi:hypothetical protein